MRARVLKALETPKRKAAVEKVCVRRQLPTVYWGTEDKKSKEKTDIKQGVRITSSQEQTQKQRHRAITRRPQQQTRGQQ